MKVIRRTRRRPSSGPTKPFVWPDELFQETVLSVPTNCLSCSTKAICAFDECLCQVRRRADKQCRGGVSSSSKASRSKSRSRSRSRSSSSSSIPSPYRLIERMGITQTTSYMGIGCLVLFLNRLIESIGTIINATLQIRTRREETYHGQAETGLKNITS